MRPLLSALVTCVFVAAPLARAQEFTLQNDSLEDGGTAAIQLGFVDGETGAATFFPEADKFPLWIKRIQIGWFSFQGGAPQILQEALVIYDGQLPNPGGVEFEAVGPVLTDGFLNEFNIEASGVIFNNPTPITVGMIFAEGGAPNGNFFAPSLVTDTDGCQPGHNPIFAIPGGWVDLCAFGASGDFMIRLVVETVGCSADVNGDGNLDVFDFVAFQVAFIANDLIADCNGDGFLDIFDFACFQQVFVEGCS